MNTIEKKTPKAAPASNGASTKKLPALPISVEPGTAWKKIHVKLITMKMPQSVALALGHREGQRIELESAEVGQGMEHYRINQWNKSSRFGGKTHPSRKKDLEEILKLELNTEVVVQIGAMDWRRIESVCKTLDISPGDWLLGAAWYSANVATEDAA